MKIWFEEAKVAFILSCTDRAYTCAEEVGDPPDVGDIVHASESYPPSLMDITSAVPKLWKDGFIFIKYNIN